MGSGSIITIGFKIGNPWRLPLLGFAPKPAPDTTPLPVPPDRYGIAIRINAGNTVDYTPLVDVQPGEVIVLGGSWVGMPARLILAHKLGVLWVTGVYAVTKSETEAVAFGETVYWDEGLQLATTTPTPVVIGKCARAALADDYKVRVLLTQGKA